MHQVGISRQLYVVYLLDIFSSCDSRGSITHCVTVILKPPVFAASVSILGLPQQLYCLPSDLTTVRQQLELLTGLYGTWIDACKRQDLLGFSLSSTLPVGLNQPPVRCIPRTKRPGRKADQRHIAARLWVSGVKPPLPHIYSWSVREQLCFCLYRLRFVWRQGH